MVICLVEMEEIQKQSHQKMVVENINLEKVRLNIFEYFLISNSFNRKILMRMTFSAFTMLTSLPRNSPLSRYQSTLVPHPKSKLLTFLIPQCMMYTFVL